MTVINTNTASINAQFNLNKVNQEMEKAMEQLSSGKRINSAADDAAGLSIATRMEAQVRGLSMAMRNASDGQSMVDTAEGAMGEISNMLQRMRELSLQAANGSNSDTDRSNLNSEVVQLKAEIDRIVGTTTFNGKNLMNGTFNGALQVGANAGENLEINIASMGTNSLGALGSQPVEATTSAAFSGTEAKATETTLTFNGNDTYNFDLTVAGLSTSPFTFDIKDAIVAGNSAADVAAKINAAIRDTAPSPGQAAPSDAAEFLRAEAAGNVVTIKNLTGGDVTVLKDTTKELSEAGATISFNSKVFDTSAGATVSDNKILGSNAFSTKVFANAGDTTAGTKEKVQIIGADVGATDKAIGDKYKITIGSTSFETAAAVAATDFDDLTKLAAALNTKAGANFTITESNGNLVVEYGTVGAVVDETVTLSKTVGTSTNFAAGTAAMVTQGTDKPASIMLLDLTGADTYSLSFGDAATNATYKGDTTFTYDGTAASLQNAATVIGNELKNTGASHFGVAAAVTAGWDFEVSVVEGRIQVAEKSGKAFNITDFGSAGAGKIGVSNAIGQSGTGDSAAILDDQAYATTATTQGAGTAKATKLDIEFSADDDYSFTISDGTSTATISGAGIGTNSLATTTQANDVVEMKASIEQALKLAGLDDVISVASTAASGTGANLVKGTITLTHSGGREITIGNFRSDSTGVMKIEAADANTSGFSKFLDDGGAAASLGNIAGISILNATDASSAMSVIDRALEDISTERSNLGAIANRLDHTIANLGNVIVNTEASQSRIEDADFAKVTGDLTKSQIMSQAATAMLAQANASKQGVLSLLQG